MFMRRLGLGGATLSGSALLTTYAEHGDDEDRRPGRDGELGGRLTRGDVAILRFLAAAEILETDLWQQYTELALGNESY